MIERPPETDDRDAISTLTKRLRRQPVFVVRGDAHSRFYGAKWQLPAHDLKADCRIDHILTCRLDGHAVASKTAEGRTLRRHSYPGVATFIPSGEYARYTLDDGGTFLELYISPGLLSEFSEQYGRRGSRAMPIQPFFAEPDPWLAGYFQILQSEIDLHRDPAPRLDTLLLGQAQQLLLAHLLHRYSGLAPSRPGALDAGRTMGGLRPHLLKRVTDYIQANLAADIRLADLAALVHLSERHFIRAFRTATGRTPYQYLLEKRLHACADLLHRADVLSVAQVAAALGFKSQSYFASRFRERYGVTPTAYRRAVGA